LPWAEIETLLLKGFNAFVFNSERSVLRGSEITHSLQQGIFSWLGGEKLYVKIGRYDVVLSLLENLIVFDTVLRR
jgi:hypothetical protein